MERKIVIAADHAGFQLKHELIDFLKIKGFEVTDLGTFSTTSVDYPDFGHPLAVAVESGRFPVGISICGSGNGINMTTNKHRGIRGALCWNVEIAELARKHNDANICSLPARFIDALLAKEIVDTFLSTPFGGGRHALRINKIPIEN